MKINAKYFLAILMFSFVLNQTFAKKVKFSVNMSTQTVSPAGIHISGNFQTLAGFPGGDWNSATTSLTIETSDTNIYSVLVDIPAHRAYQFKFVNGDLFYEVEFVPEESRVGHDFNDSRWFYLDSLTNDTTLIGVLPFGENAPIGKKLLRLKVDVKNQTSIDPSGVFVAATFNNFSYTNAKMYSFTNTAFEYFTYVDSGATIEYNFANGNNSSKAENIVGNCATNNKRNITVNDDTVLDSVCFATCTLCQTTGIGSTKNQTTFNIYPNPATDVLNIETNISYKNLTLTIFDITGKVVWNQNLGSQKTIKLDRNALKSNVYFIKVSTERETFLQKIILQ